MKLYTSSIAAKYTNKNFLQYIDLQCKVSYLLVLSGVFVCLFAYFRLFLCKLGNICTASYSKFPEVCIWRTISSAMSPKTIDLNIFCCYTAFFPLQFLHVLLSIINQSLSGLLILKLRRN